VMSYTCLPRTVACNMTPADVKMLEPSRLRTGATLRRARVLVAASDAVIDAGSSDISRSP